jgi:hypothetical protein
VTSPVSPNGALSSRAKVGRDRSEQVVAIDWNGWSRSSECALYQQCREQGQREASPTAAIIDSQSVKSAEKGGPASIRRDTMQARRSRARSGIFSSIL